MCLRQKNSKLLLVARPVEQKNREGRECIVASWVPAPDVQCIGCLRPHGELCQLRTQCARGAASEFLRPSHDFTVIKGYHQTTPAFLGYGYMDLAAHWDAGNKPPRARSEERRGGKECVSTCKLRCSP